MVYLIPFYLTDLPFMIDTALAFHLKIPLAECSACNVLKTTFLHLSYDM